jgi:peptide/nickel transport system permease protein
MCEVLSEDHVKAIKAYGIGKFRTYTYYAFKPILIPLLTVVGLTFGYMIGNSVIVEGIFNWPGIGSYALSSVINNDYAALLGSTLFLSGTYLLINLLVDLIAVLIDPRFSATDY